MNLFTQAHRRFNPLTSEWVLVSPHRTQRPWLGQVETPVPDTRPMHDPGCYLCPGNERAGHKRNPAYAGVFVFDNDFAALLPDVTESENSASSAASLLRAEHERGICRVICFSPRHDWTLPQMPRADICRVVETWIAQTRDLGALDWVNYVLVFENKGAMMGASNPHPHGQVWASEHLPTEPAKELRAQTDYLSTRGSCLLCDYLALELGQGERVVMENEHFVVVVPFWAVWPFETMLLSRRHLGSFTDLNADECDALADMIHRLTALYDRLFNCSFPYSMGFHQAPTDALAHTETHFHAHYYPPLLRSATIRKFMVGYEMLGNPQRDITPEIAATRLREIGQP